MVIWLTFGRSCQRRLRLCKRLCRVPLYGRGRRQEYWKRNDLQGHWDLRSMPIHRRDHPTGPLGESWPAGLGLTAADAAAPVRRSTGQRQRRGSNEIHARGVLDHTRPGEAGDRGQDVRRLPRIDDLSRHPSSPGSPRGHTVRSGDLSLTIVNLSRSVANCTCTRAIWTCASHEREPHSEFFHAIEC